MDKGVAPERPTDVLVGPPAGDPHVPSDRRPNPPYVITPDGHCPSARYCEPESLFRLLTRALGDPLHPATEPSPLTSLDSSVSTTSRS